MNPTDEDLMHRFYAGGLDALYELAQRYDPTLSQIAVLILTARTGSAVQALAEWDVNQRIGRVWTYVLSTREVNIGRWPNQRISVLTWLVHLISLEMDNHLGFRGPF